MNAKLQSLGKFAYPVAVLICLALTAIGFGLAMALHGTLWHKALLLGVLVMVYVSINRDYPRGLWSMPAVGIIMETFYGYPAWPSAVSLFGVFAILTGFLWANQVHKDQPAT